ncbi:MAG: AzlC family ABC transporter permease [Actinomycetota bacterium]|nr:AzlC family ABC transporter permease [Actinomycetota bacterium]MDA3001430.1 AzlC family ABC transporter permease [Actinomycetota bacterium]
MSSSAGPVGRSTGDDVRWWNDQSLRPMIVACTTLSMAVGVFGVSFGVGSVAAGASIAQTCALSLLVFTGASQFSAVSVIGAGGSFGSALGGALLLAARNGVYGLAMSRRIDGRLGTRLLAAQLTIDETTAMSVGQSDPRAQRIAFWFTGFALYAFWNVGTLLGAVAGSAIDPTTYGLDAAFPAGFVAMVWPLLSDRRARQAAVLGGMICLVAIPVTAVGVPILLSALAVLVGLQKPIPSPTGDPS